ncbi:MAG: PilZ domain-containing protein [Spirochaetales bacterium]|nr:PilZ domain-containing protein [Spirochaetales bacterium]
MDWDGIDLREYERLDAKQTPKGLEEFRIDFGDGKLIKSATTDFSVKGLRLIARCSKSEINVGDVIILKPSGFEYSLIGEVVYAFEADETMLYIGIKLHPSRALGNYASEVEKVLAY